MAAPHALYRYTVGVIERVHVWISICIRNKGKASTGKHCKPSSNVLTDRSKVVLLLWILFVIYVSCSSVILSCLFLVTLW